MNAHHANKRATDQKWRDCSTQKKTGNSRNILVCGGKLWRGEKPNERGVLNAEESHCCSKSGEVHDIRRDWEPGDGLLTGPNPAGMQMRLRASSDYLLPADSFDSLCGEFFCNTLTRWRPDGGTPMCPSSTISLAVSLRP